MSRLCFQVRDKPRADVYTGVGAQGEAMSNNGAVWALGTMSGTSMDGVDAALLKTDGRDIFDFGESVFCPYSDDDRAVLRAALGRWSGPEVEAAAEVVERVHAECLAGFSDADVVGFHGQTLAHAPDRGQTLQVGNGALLAEVLEKAVVWDFRSNDMALGGQGAPLAPFYHFALARFIGAQEPLIFLNIGGVSNITFVDPSKEKAEATDALLAFDTGPGNAKIDDLVKARTGAAMDEGGALTRAGVVDGDLLEEMLNGSFYFAKVPPKSLDREDFSGWSASVAGLETADAVATLAAASAGAISLGLEHCPSTPTRILVTGGGRKNPGIMEMLAALVPCPVDPVEAVGLDGDMLEAQAFAYLAVRVLRGLPTSAPGTTGVAAPVGGGRVSKPGELTRHLSGAA